MNRKQQIKRGTPWNKASEENMALNFPTNTALLMLVSMIGSGLLRGSTCHRVSNGSYEASLIMGALYSVQNALTAARSEEAFLK